MQRLCAPVFSYFLFAQRHVAYSWVATMQTLLHSSFGFFDRPHLMLSVLVTHVNLVYLHLD